MSAWIVSAYACTWICTFTAFATLLLYQFSSHVPLFFFTGKIIYYFSAKNNFWLYTVTEREHIVVETFFVVCNWDSYQFRYMHNSDVYFWSFCHLYGVITICTLSRCNKLCTAYSQVWKLQVSPSLYSLFSSISFPVLFIGCAVHIIFIGCCRRTHTNTHTTKRTQFFLNFQPDSNHCYNSVHVARF